MADGSTFKGGEVNQELLKRLAREACMTEPDLDTREWDHELWKASTDDLRRFAALVAEACVQRCNEVAAHDLSLMSPRQAVEHVAASIRAMFQEPTP